MGVTQTQRKARDLSLKNWDHVSVQTAYEMHCNNQGRVVDVRHPREIEDYPPAAGAVFLPLYILRGFLGEPARAEEDEAPLATIVSTMPSHLGMLNLFAAHRLRLLCLCRTGRDSLEAVRLLHLLGYQNASSVAGGMEAWAAANLPVVRNHQGTPE